MSTLERKRLTVLFCDVVASTELGERLDPEAVHKVMGRYFGIAQNIIERHGGTVEKFVGDAVMAAFGVPVLHEDDALRAARAAIELRDAMASLNEELAESYDTHVALRIGVNTGEVVTTGDDPLATGDAVNVAARLEQSAGPDEILLGAQTHALIRSAVVAEPLAPLLVKGKRAPLAAWRLLSVSGEGVPRRRLDTPLVNREVELRRLLDAFDVTVRERTCTLVTILGAAGVGKSRLAHELMTSLGPAGVVRGRCASYGEGITYQPVVEVVRELEPQLSQLRLDTRVVTTLRSLLSGDESIDSTDEIAFAVRKLLEAVAADLPLVCVFDDIQWGEPAFLDLIEQILSLSRDAPLMLCCIGRPELLDSNPGFGRSHPNATTLALEGLAPEETDRLIDHLAADAPVSTPLRDRIRETAEGNPLFVEEMIRLLREAPDGEIPVPPTIHALLTARLDQLDPAERTVLQRGAVEGRVFHRGAVQVLAPHESQVGARLAALVRKGLLHPEHTRFSGEDAYRFRHQLIRDAAYETLPKAARAELHERFAGWLGSRTQELADADDLVGYHLEQAYRYRLELWPLDDHARTLGASASELLAAAGARALGRNDVGAAEKLLRRALSLRSENDPAVALRLDLTHALFLSGEFAAAGDLARETASLAAARGNRVGELRARLAVARLVVQMPPQDGATPEPSAALLALAEEARPIFSEAGDEVGLTDAWAATAWAELIRSRWGAMLDAVEHAITHARRAGHTRWERELPVWKGTALFYGPTPVEEMLRWQEDELPQHSMALNHRAVLEAMRARFAAARALLVTADNAAAERGETLWRAGGAMAEWEVETLAGDPAAAERAARRTCDWLEELGETGFRSLAIGQLAWSLYALGRLDDAERLTQQAEALASADDVLSHMLWRQVRARLHARAGRPSEAEQLAREAVSLGEETEMPNWHAHALVDLGDICVLAGKSDEGRRHLAHALELYERKGNIVSAAHVRAALGGPDASANLVSDGTTF
ncbi:MAG TPA: adenylate/guanylate cyclase domain-containing protein [Gaiellaceae bacterium]|jgi:class 3 adenylate cyclase/tetratricopeptide (TPR) repeat protein